jgi:hypothetical protein
MKSPKHNKNRKTRKTNDSVNLDLSDQSLLDFKQSKSISIATKSSDIKSSRLGELYSVKSIHDSIMRLCQNKVQAKASKHAGTSIPKSVSKDICNCLFEKNKGLTVTELEKKIEQRDETPASSCITILDKHLSIIHGKNMKKRSKSTTNTRKSSKAKKSSKSSKGKPHKAK